MNVLLALDADVRLTKSRVDQKNIFYRVIYLEQIEKWFENILWKNP